MRMGLNVSLRSAPAMLAPGALIVLLVDFGFATRLLGMVLVFPLQGHAAWYAYRDLVIWGKQLSS